MTPVPTGELPTYHLPDGRLVTLLDREGQHRSALIPYTPVERRVARNGRTHHLQVVNVGRLVRRGGRGRGR